MSKLINNFIANVFDIYPSDKFLTTFINDNNFNIEAVLKHPFLNHSLCYSFIWNVVFKNYPTKRDFQIYLDLNKYLPSTDVQYDNKFIENILNSFAILRFGFISYLNLQEISKQFDAFFKELNDPLYKQNCLYDKWRYRYNLSEQETDAARSVNLFHTFSNILKCYKPPSLDSIDTHDVVNTETLQDSRDTFDNLDARMNPISRNYIVNIGFTDMDNTYLNEYEKIQYVIFKDNHFLLKLLGNTIICLGADDNIEEEQLQNIIRIYNKVEDRHVVLFNYKGTNWDSSMTFEVPSDLHNCIPRISKNFLLISNKKFPEFNALSIKRENSIYYLSGNVVDNNEQSKITNSYDRYIINDIRNNNIVCKLNKYCILNPYVSDKKKIDRNKFIYYGPKTRIDFNIVDEIDKDQCDFVVDLYGELDLIPFMVRGVIPIVKENTVLIQQDINGFYVKTTDEVKYIIEYTESIILNKIRENCELFRYLTDPLMNETYWKYHIRGGCPTRSIGPNNGVLLYLNFIILYFSKKLKNICDITKINHDSLNKVILIDNRPNPLSLISVLFSMSNLDENWSPIIYTSKKGLEYYQRNLGSIAQIRHLKDLDVMKFHIDIYNNIMKKPEFWSDINGYKCLVIQDDGILLRKGIQKFEEYDYIGASWADCVANEFIKNNISKELVGNGGISLRTVSKMIEVATKFNKEKTWLFYKNVTQVPEDVYFVNGLNKLKNVNLPNFETGKAFASEQICHYTSLGIHKMWAYQMGEIVQTYFNKILGEI